VAVIPGSKGKLGTAIQKGNSFRLARMGEKKHAYRILVGKPEGKYH
jgi:hypothetical protein